VQTPLVSAGSPYCVHSLTDDHDRCSLQMVVSSSSYIAAILCIRYLADCTPEPTCFLFPDFHTGLCYGSCYHNNQSLFLVTRLMSYISCWSIVLGRGYKSLWFWACICWLSFLFIYYYICPAK
jgi:hypothetical protein